MMRQRLFATGAAVAAVLTAAACAAGPTGRSPGTADVAATTGGTGRPSSAGSPGAPAGSTITSATATSTASHGTAPAASSNPAAAGATSVPGTSSPFPSSPPGLPTGPTIPTTGAPGTTSISLASWAGLVLPVNTAGQLSGNTAKVLSPAQLISPWLTGTGAGLQFWAPEGAATTTHSLHARTELESAIKYAVATQRHSLNATLQILQLPQSNPEICVAQLHAGGSGGSNPFVMVDYKSGKLYVMVASGTTAPPSFYTLLTNVALGAAFTYQVTDNGDGTLTLAASAGGQHQSYTVAVPSVLRGVSGHFSAGDYEQGTVSGGPNDGGKVLFSALDQT